LSYSPTMDRTVGWSLPRGTRDGAGERTEAVLL